MYNDVSLLITVYPPYTNLLGYTLAAIEKHWPQHPTIYVDRSSCVSIQERLLAALNHIATPFVVLMHEDYRLFLNVRQNLFDECLQTMREDTCLTSCSLTWEPSDTDIYHFPKQSYTNTRFQRVPKAWNYCINFQSRIWKTSHLKALLQRLPANLTNSDLEPTVSTIFRERFPNLDVITFAFPDPPNPSTFVDETYKGNWILPYHNLIHAGKTKFHCPVYINNRNRLTTTKSIVEHLRYMAPAIPIIIDNDSTYPPLLEWYDHCNVEVIRLGKNYGPQAVWEMQNPARDYTHYVVTDSDLDISKTPNDTLNLLRDALQYHPEVCKAGLSLEINDLLPSPLTDSILNWEKQFWTHKADSHFWKAAIDTTFAMYRSGQGWGGTKYHSALRADRPYTARHVSWYCSDSPEEKFYWDHAEKQHSFWAKAIEGFVP